MSVNDFVEASDDDSPQPRTVKDFQNVLTDYVAETGLGKFFAPDDPFIQDLAGRAAKLRESSDPLGKPENLKNLITLSLYHPIIYCDDSGSMAADDRYLKQRDLVSRIARIATKIVPDDLGVELRFINSRITKSNMTTDQIDQTLESVSPRGGTKIGTTLKNDILKPFVYDRLADAKDPFKRPYLVCVITDGEPTNEPQSTFKDAIVECRTTLDSHKTTPRPSCSASARSETTPQQRRSWMPCATTRRSRTWCTALRRSSTASSTSCGITSRGWRSGSSSS